MALEDEPYDCKELYGDALISPFPNNDEDVPMRPGVVGVIIGLAEQVAAILKQDAPGFIALPILEWDATDDALTAFNPQAKLLAKLDATDEALHADAAQLL